MKKIIKLIFIVSIFISLVGCNNKVNKVEEVKENESLKETQTIEGEIVSIRGDMIYLKTKGQTYGSIDFIFDENDDVSNFEKGDLALSHFKNVRLGISSIGREHGDDTAVRERCNFKVLSTYYLDDIHLSVKGDDVYIRSKEIHEQAKRDLRDEIASQKIIEGETRSSRAISVSLPRDFNALYEMCKDEEVKEQVLGINIKDKIFDRDFLINNPEKYEDEEFARFLVDEYNNELPTIEL